MLHKYLRTLRRSRFPCLRRKALRVSTRALMSVFLEYIPGAPVAVIALEILIAAGARKFLVFGGYGAIHPSVKIYDIVIPTWGIREEGTSYHYYPPDVVPKPNEKIMEALQRELRCTAQSLGTRLYTGRYMDY